MRILAVLISLVPLFSACTSSHDRDLDAPSTVDAVLSSVDAARPDAIGVDAQRSDAGPTEVSCAAMDAREAFCTVGCFGPPSFAWDGAACRAIPCGACEGRDCARTYGSLGECQAAHASCPASLCHATRGQWIDGFCGLFRCGEPADVACLIPQPGCDCGPTGRFGGAGCEFDPSCPAPPPVVDPAGLCRATGGTWANTCCPSVCGMPCPLACAGLACTCGPSEVWDDVRGCIVGEACQRNRPPGSPCELESGECADGLVCCQRCSGAACGVPSCQEPVCREGVDVCGNDPRAA